MNSKILFYVHMLSTYHISSHDTILCFFHLMLKPYVVGDRKQSVAINTNYIQTINAYIYATLYDKNVDVLDFDVL